MNDKKTGSFYTPLSLVKHMTKFAVEQGGVNSILEPSVGDGRFIKELEKYNCIIDAVEIDPQKIAYLRESNQQENVNLFNANFIEYSLKSTKKYNLIIGNPPYISKKGLSQKEKTLSIELMDFWGLPETLFQNLWVTFVLGALKLLDPNNGSIFFVLPFEFLQVNYAEKLRSFLESKFNTIEITTFRESVFPELDQDVCLVYMSNAVQVEPIVTYKTVTNITDFKLIDFSQIQRNKPIKKWSNAILNDNEIELLKQLSEKFTPVSHFGDISPGIVTGANDYFILDQNKVKNLKCDENTIPIIQKGSYLKKSLLIFTSEDFIFLKESHKKIWMLNLNNIEDTSFSDEINEYLTEGIEKKIHERYKCKRRKRWYDVPILRTGDLMFFKRYDKLPRLIVNDLGVYSTDVSYNIRLNPIYDSSSLAFCFYNSLTLTLSEFNGRFYGGGVAELVPSEFKSLVVPYMKIGRDEIIKLDSMMRNNAPSARIIDYVDSIVLKEVEPDALRELKKIREKYLIRRLKGAYNKEKVEVQRESI